MANDPKIRYDILANAEGGEDVAKLARELQKLDDAVDPSSAAAAKALADELARLATQRQALDGFSRALVDANEAGRKLEQTTGALDKLKRELEGVETPTRAQAGQLQKLGEAARRAQEDLTRNNEALSKARDALERTGAASTDLAGAEARLATATAEVRREVAQLGQQGQALQTLRDLATATDDARAKFGTADKALEDYRASLQGLEEPSAAQQRRLTSLSEAARKAQIAYQEAAQAQAKAASDLRAAGVDTDRLVTAQNRLPGALTATATAARSVAGAYDATGTAAQKSAAQQLDANADVKRGLDGIASQLGTLRNIGIAGILGSETAQLLRGVAETADAFGNLRARIQLVTGEGEPLQQALAGVEAIALRTGQSLQGTGELFSRILASGKEINVTQEQALRLTETINQAVAVSGASASASDAAITQLLQGLGSGVLRGEEFNSVMEQTPRLAQALADGLGVTRGQLRALANDGKLSSETVIQALQSQAGALQREFGALPQTIGRSIQNLQTSWTTFVGGLNDATGATAIIAGGINSLAANLDELGEVATRAGAVLLAALAVQGAGALRTLALQATASAGAMALLRTNIEQIPKVVNIAIAVTGFEAGFQIGQFLRENSELARKLGVGISEFFVALVNDLQFVKEAAAAIFTDDTIGQAFDRFKARAEQQREIFAQLYEEAEQSPEVVRAAAAVAERELKDLGTAGTAAGKAVASGGTAGAAGVATIGKAASAADAAIATLATAAGVKLPAIAKTAEDQARALAQVAVQGGKVAAALGQELPAAIGKLNGRELGAFRDTLVGALREAGDKGALLQSVIVATGRRAAEVLGVDVPAATNTLSDSFVTAQDNLATLIKSVDAMRAAGLDAGAVLTEALRKMADQAKTQAEFDALRARIEALGKAGTISKTQVSDLLDTLGTKAKDAAGKVDDLAKAYKALGITTQAELQKQADDAEKAWQTIRDSGTATLRDQIAAWEAYRQKAVAANGGVVSSAIQLQDNILQNQAAAQGLGRTFSDSMGAASGAVQGTTTRVRELGAAAGTAQTRAETAQQAFERLLRSDPSRLADGAGLGGIGPQGNIGSSAYTQARNASITPATSATANFSPQTGLLPVTSTGTIYTPPPDNSGDWVWKPALNQNSRGGTWVPSPAAIERAEAERKASTSRAMDAYRQAGIPLPAGGVPTFASAYPQAVRDILAKGTPPSTPAANQPSPPDNTTPLQNQLQAQLAAQAQQMALLLNQRSGGAPAAAVPAPSQVVEIRFSRPDGSAVSVTAGSKEQADALIRLLEEEYRLQGGG